MANARFLTKILEIKTLGTTVILAAYCHKTVPTHDDVKKNILTTAEGE